MYQLTCLLFVQCLTSGVMMYRWCIASPSSIPPCLPSAVALPPESVEVQKVEGDKVTVKSVNATWMPVVRAVLNTLPDNEVFFLLKLEWCSLLLRSNQQP